MNAERILVVRRDNIGDLVCTIPLILALRQRHPEAYIAALVNSYNAAVLQNHPAINDLFAYTKLKHRGEKSVLRAYLERIDLVRKLRKRRFDVAYVAGPASPSVMRTVRILGPQRIVRATGGSPPRHGETVIALPDDAHEVTRTLALLGAERSDEIFKPAIHPDPSLARTLNGQIAAALDTSRPLIAVHISARKPSQRWRNENFVQLIRALTSTGRNVLVLWSPGREDDPRHPGDDRKARELEAACVGRAVAFLPTPTLPHLIAALSLCQMVICSDGGAMHLAAALDKPIVCLFGNSDAKRWHPYGVPYRLLQPGTRDVNDIASDAVFRAFLELESRSSRDDEAEPSQ